MKDKKTKLLVIIGPTSSGKSELAVKLARRFNGEIISADSRQVYKGMDLGTGKIEGKWKKGKYFYKNIVHHTIDFASPSSQFSSARYKTLTQKTLKDIHRRGKLPILCGGTMHWIDAVVYDQNLPDVKPNAKLRERLGKKSANNLYLELKKLDSARAKTIDKHNKRRLIRALEIIITTGKPVPKSPPKIGGVSRQESGRGGIYNTLWIGLSVPQKTLDKKIKRRLLQRIKQGMIAEVKNLHSPPRHLVKNNKKSRSVSWKRLENFGLEYRYVSRYLRGMMSYDELLKLLATAIRQYSKRQMTWWKRNKEIHWIKPDPKQAAKMVPKFLKS